MVLIAGRDGVSFVRADGATVGRIRAVRVAGLDAYELSVTFMGATEELASVSGLSPEAAARMVVDEYRRRQRRWNDRRRERESEVRP